MVSSEPSGGAGGAGVGEPAPPAVPEPGGTRAASENPCGFGVAAWRCGSVSGRSASPTRPSRRRLVGRSSQDVHQQHRRGDGRDHRRRLQELRDLVHCLHVFPPRAIDPLMTYGQYTAFSYLLANPRGGGSLCATLLHPRRRRPPGPERGKGRRNAEEALSPDGVSASSVVELRGIEPLTSSMRTKRATNCATAPCGSCDPLGKL